MTITTTPRRTPSGKKIRDRQRLAHLVTGVLLIAYVYMPSPGPVLDAAIRFALLPLLAITGVLMWQWPKVRRWTRRWTGKS